MPSRQQGLHQAQEALDAGATLPLPLSALLEGALVLCPNWPCAPELRKVGLQAGAARLRGTGRTPAGAAGTLGGVDPQLFLCSCVAGHLSRGASPTRAAAREFRDGAPNVLS